MSTCKLDKIWTKNGQNWDISLSKICPIQKTWEKEIYSWTISEHFVQNMDNYLTKLSQTEIIWTNIGH